MWCSCKLLHRSNQAAEEVQHYTVPDCSPAPPSSCPRGDLDLWSRWLRFCQRTRSSKQMSKVLTKALQLHSGCAALWTYAAAWEFESNLNAAAARALMQRGLRMCKHAPQVCPGSWLAQQVWAGGLQSLHDGSYCFLTPMTTLLFRKL